MVSAILLQYAIDDPLLTRGTGLNLGVDNFFFVFDDFFHLLSSFFHSHALLHKLLFYLVCTVAS